MIVYRTARTGNGVECEYPGEANVSNLVVPITDGAIEFFLRSDDSLQPAADLEGYFGCRARIRTFSSRLGWKALVSGRGGD